MRRARRSQLDGPAAPATSFASVIPRVFLAAAIIAIQPLVGCSAPQQQADLPPLMPMVAAPPQPAEPKPPPPKPVKPKPEFSAHVASYKTLADAQAAWPRLVQQFPALKDQPRHYAEIDLGGQRGKVVRLLLGEFAASAEATEYCHRLRAAGLYCAPHDLPPSLVAKTGL
jgi:hypothetical protein